MVAAARLAYPIYLAAICGIRLSKNQINPRLNHKKPYLEISDQPVFRDECKYIPTRERHKFIINQRYRYT
jgi:hypothetical protein